MADVTRRQFVVMLGAALPASGLSSVLPVAPPFLEKTGIAGNTELRCSFCNRSQRETRKLIAGPGCHICNECVALCTALLMEEAREAAGSAPRPPAAHPPELGKLWCSFCGKNQAHVGKLIAGPNTYVCNECVELCAEITGEAFEHDEGDDSPARLRCTFCGTSGMRKAAVRGSDALCASCQSIAFDMLRGSDCTGGPFVRVWQGNAGPPCLFCAVPAFEGRIVVGPPGGICERCIGEHRILDGGET